MYLERETVQTLLARAASLSAAGSVFIGLSVTGALPSPEQAGRVEAWAPWLAAGSRGGGSATARRRRRPPQRG